MSKSLIMLTYTPMYAEIDDMCTPIIGIYTVLLNDQQRLYYMPRAWLVRTCMY